MSKNKKNNSKAKAQINTNAKVVEPIVDESTNQVVDVAVADKSVNEEQVVPVEDTPKLKNEKGKNKVTEVKTKDINKKDKKKEKKPNKMVKSLKDTGSELKKVTWPKFKDVVKQTGIVLAFTIVLAIVLFGIDQLCSLLTGLLF